jgi:uncharacterized membrane protein YphA (DoxX/SURF4 family)
MKTVTTIVASLLGLIFVVFGLNFWLNFIPVPPPPEGTPAAAFIGALYGSGYLAVVKAIEVLGGVALLVPRFRRLGIILIAAVVFNIATFHVAFFGWGSLVDPVVLFSIVATLFLVRMHSLCSCLAGCGTCNPEGTGCCNSGSSCCSTEGSCSSEKTESKGGCCGGH